MVDVTDDDIKKLKIILSFPDDKAGGKCGNELLQAFLSTKMGKVLSNEQYMRLLDAGGTVDQAIKRLLFRLNDADLYNIKNNEGSSELAEKLESILGERLRGGRFAKGT